MKKRARTLVVVSIIAILLGIIAVAVALFIHFILGMDTVWFISRFGPNGDPAYRTYERLYEMSLILSNLANKYVVAFYITLGVGLVAFGVVCGFWARDIKRIKNYYEKQGK